MIASALGWTCAVTLIASIICIAIGSIAIEDDPIIGRLLLFPGIFLAIFTFLAGITAIWLGVFGI